MNKSESDDSQNEGFHVNQPCIDSHNLKQQTKQEKNNKKFEPRFISGSGVLRKQPKQCYQYVSNIPIKDNSFTYIPSENINNHEQIAISAFEKYNNLNEYSLVYSRNKEPFGSQYRSAFQNQINLKYCEHYKEDTFKLLRDFDEKNLFQQPCSQNNLVIDSRFQSGNLLCGFKQKKQNNTYVLFMQNDTNTHGYNQWFYFSIRNAKKHIKYTFKIANYRKSYSFFKLGLKPLVFSLKKAKQTGNGWYRDGKDIEYYKSNFSEVGCTPYYTLKFSIQFQNDHDYITLSPYAPYSYSRLIYTLANLQKIAIQNQLNWKMKSISHSLTRTQIPYISITKNQSSNHSKQNIIVLARQHSGETWSSFLAQEIIRQIVQQKSQYSKWLVQNYVFRIFPMINVDGVIYGNFRCDLAGYDLNRTWKSPFNSIHPQILNIKQEIQKLNDKNGISLCYDLHTHSKQLGVFAYCCVQSEKGRQLPSIFGKITPVFRFPACTFGISNQKQGTARATVYNFSKNINTITIELSAFGFKAKQSKYAQSFSPNQMKIISKTLVYGYYCYLLKIQPKMLELKLQNCIYNQSQTGYKAWNQPEYNEDQPVMGSDSQPQVDEIEIKLRIQNVFPDEFIEDIISITRKKNKKTIKNIKKMSNYTPMSKKLTQQKSSLKKERISPQLKRQNTKSNKTQTKPSSYKSIDSTDEKVIVTPHSKTKQTKIQANDQPLYKKTHKIYPQKSVKVQIERATKPLNLIEFSLKKLPIMAQQKIVPNQNYMIDQSFPIVGGLSYARKQQDRFDKTFSTYEAMCRPRVRANSRKIGLTRQKNRLQQQLPYLCVMSQNKRLLHFQNLRDKIIQEQGTQLRTFHNSILNGHRQKNVIANKLKNSQKYPNGDLLSRLTDEFTRYDQLINSKKHQN